MEKGQVIYYKDEVNEEFAPSKLTPRIIDKSFKYEKNAIWEVCSTLFQNILSMPIKIGYAKLKLRIKFVGKEKLKKHKNTGYFIYANHTQSFADTFIPSLANYPKRNFLIVNPVNISLKGTGNIVEMLGAIPVPNTKDAAKEFLKIISKRIETGSSVTIYPEAHIWPYYTKIRPFKSVSFKYPVKLNKPSFCITNTYQRYEKNKIQIVTYIDGPFIADKDLSPKEAQEKLRNEIYNCMVERSKNNNIEYIKYVKV